MHSYYANKSQSVNNSNYTIMVAEVASTVNEIILAENILKKEKDIEKRKKIIAELIGTITSTLVRQSMFAEFERFNNNLRHEFSLKGHILTQEQKLLMNHIGSAMNFSNIYDLIENEIKFEKAEDKNRKSS